MTDLRSIAVALQLLLSSTWHVGIGTTFGPTALDPVNRDDRAACVSGNPSVDPEWLGVALPAKVAPCGAEVVVWSPRTWKAVRAHVVDRGPRRGLVDLLPATARRIGHNGRERVVVGVIGRWR